MLIEVILYMKKFAIYGKGGIGKSTITSSLSAAFSTLGYKVLQIGCDPKADSTSNLLGGDVITPVTDYLRTHEDYPSLEEIALTGYNGIHCIEAGGPTPGIGCAGRGILTTFNLLEDLEAFEVFKPDIVLYDVLGDVVCGGFAAPIRNGYADKVLIVTSGEKMSLFAAQNICNAISNFQGRNYAHAYGVILNRRNVPDEEKYVNEFALRNNLPILADIPRDTNIQLYENRGKTVIEGDPTLPISRNFISLAKKLAEYED